MKKFLSLTVLICLSFTLISCGQKEFVFEDDSEINFLGAAFTVFSKDEWLSEKRQRGASASSDRFLNRIEKIEKDYNVRIANESGNLENKILAMTLNGGNGCDMIFCNNDILYECYTLGILTPFEEIGVKNTKDIKFGIPSLLIEGTFGGTQYGIINYLGDGAPGVSGFIQINMNMMRDLGLTDPHEYFEKGEWNWENLRVELIKGTVTEGEENHVGMLCPGPLLGGKSFFGPIISNGGYIIKEIDGTYQSGLTEQNAFEAMEFVVGLVNDGILTLGTNGTPWDLWVEGRIWPFMMDGGPAVNDEIEYSIIRFPYGPHGNKDIVAAYSYSRSYYAFTILSGFENSDIGVIVDDLFEPLDAGLYPEGWKDYTKENIFYCDSDYETYMTGLETMNYYPIGVLYGTNQWSNDEPVESAMENILFGRGGAQSEMESVKDFLNQIIDEKLNYGQ